MITSRTTPIALFLEGGWRYAVEDFTEEVCRSIQDAGLSRIDCQSDASPATKRAVIDATIAALQELKGKL